MLQVLRSLSQLGHTPASESNNALDLPLSAKAEKLVLLTEDACTNRASSSSLVIVYGIRWINYRYELLEPCHRNPNHSVAEIICHMI